jgi:hypothetical protein
VSVTIPEARADGGQGGQDRTVLVNAQLNWGFNLETRGKSYAGECNFLMAGKPGATGDAGAARHWGPDGWGRNLYHAEAGHAAVVDSQGRAVPFERRCLDPAGQPVVYNAAKQSASTYTDTQVVLRGGSGWRDNRTGQAEVAWQGSFSVVYYDGLTYFWLENPVLTVSASGAAELTATAGGYGSPREGGAWGAHPATAVTLAVASAASDISTAESIVLSESGLTLKHAYAGRAVAVPEGAAAQKLGGESTHPGAWPQSFVDFHGLTGLNSYWYSSGAAIDHRKPPDPAHISWDAARPLETPVATGTPATAGQTGGWSGGQAIKAAAATRTSAGQSAGQGGAGAATAAADPWSLQFEPVVVSKAPKDLVPERITPAGASIAVDAAILTLLVSASTALIAWRRGWFRLRPKGIIP